MGLVCQIIFLSLIINFLFADSGKDPDFGSGGSKVEEMVEFGYKQPSVLLLTIIDLVKEVKELNCLVKANSEKLENVELELGKKIQDVKLSCQSVVKNDEMESKLVDTIEEVETRLAQNIVDTIEEVESRLAQNIEDMESNVIGNIGEIDSKVRNVDSKIEVWRSEVRLISQQKLTWQNDTHSNHFSDFAVDGVYTLDKRQNGVNPISHLYGSKVNHMLIIDLGGFFKIHSVKIWNRPDCCQDGVGVLIYADEELIGNIYEAKRLYNFYAKDKVYARKIYLKQGLPRDSNYLEVQVYGTGPYEEYKVKR